MTVVSTLAARRDSIPWEDLSLAFQDAIRVCEKLHVKYLWIDSLCIIQDNLADWEAEATKMAEYYENALVTISAASSPDGSVRFLRERSPRWKPRLFSLEPHPLRGPTDDGSVTDVMTREIPCFENPEDRDPLFSRAWVWQEALLSVRNIAFCAAGLIWDCRTECVAEDGGDGRHLSDKVHPRDVSAIEAVNEEKRDDIVREQSPRDDPGDTSLRDRHLDGWRAVVASYTLNSLTVATDRLPALSGVASRFQRHLNTRYLAGLWEHTLPYDLLWFRWESRRARSLDEDNIFSLGRAPGDYIAPSWSWASVGHAVSFAEPHAVVMSRVEEAACYVSGLNPFGTVSEGFLRLTGPVVRCCMRCTSSAFYNTYTLLVPETKQQPKFFVDCELLGGRDNMVRRATWGDPSCQFTEVVTCLALGHPGREGNSVCCLVLGQPADGPCVRLGLGFGFDLGLFKNVREETLLIR